MPEHITRLIDLFLSTPSARRATKRARQQDCANVISIHALREEGDSASPSNRISACISIHALREEGDTFLRCRECPGEVFLSTPSARRATNVDCLGFLCGLCISIHALREEGDSLIAKVGSLIISFLSTPSARRATPRTS